MRPQDGPLGLRRAAGTFALVAWAGVVLVLVMGVTLVARGTAGPPTSVELGRAVAAGEPLQMVASTSARLVYGAPADLDLAAVTCVGSAPAGSRELDVAAERQVVNDATGGGDLVLLVRVETMPLVTDVTCSGGGLERVGSTSAGSAGTARVLGVVLLLLAPVLAVVGLVARRASRPAAR